MLSFKDINELVEQNVKLRSLVLKLSADEKKKEAELRYNFQIEGVTDDASSKVEVVLKRSDEQASMIESLHSSVAMYKRFYEEENKFRTSSSVFATAVSDDRKKGLMLLLEGPQKASKKAYEQLFNRTRILEEDVDRLSTELISARAERDKMSLEAIFSNERLESFMKEFYHQRSEINAISGRNMELTHLLIDYQKRLRESSASLQASEENSRKLSKKVSILMLEREILVSSEKRTSKEFKTLMERVDRLQSTLDAIQSAEEVRERDWAEAKRELQEERDHIRILTFEKERALVSSKSQVEDIRKELANVWHSVATAESRTAVVEARCCDLEEKIKSIGKQAVTEVGNDEQSWLSTNEISEESRRAKEELEKVKDEARASKEYMLQYKEVACVNEIALKQLESAHEVYKLETVKMMKVLEDEAQSLKNQVSKLERNYMLKCEETASIFKGKEQTLSFAMAEISRLRDEVAEKLTSLTELQIQMSSLKVDLDKEHKRLCIARANYERQVILQSETIQEFTNTSRELSLLQEENLRLCELLDAQKAENEFTNTSRELSLLKEENLRMCELLDAQKDENELLKLSWETEKSKLQHMKSEAERNYYEMHEQAKTEIALLIQEKLRLQSTVDGALKASESAQALLYSQLENAREILLLKDEEFKSLQLQVQEINLLRESIVQLRVENKYSFEESQRFREEAQKAKAESNNLESLLKLKQIELNSLQKDVEVLEIEITNLNNKNVEILESCKNININEYEQMKAELEQFKLSWKTEMSELQQMKSEAEKNYYEMHEQAKTEIALLIQENLRLQSTVDGALKASESAQALLHSQLENARELLLLKDEEFKSLQLQVREINLFKESIVQLQVENKHSFEECQRFREEAQKAKAESDYLERLLKLKQIELDGIQKGAEFLKIEITGLNNRNAELLEKTLERVSDDNQNEKQRRKKFETTMVEFADKINMEKQKLEDELQKHKSAIFDVLEKAGMLASQLPSESSLDERTIAYFQSVSSYGAAKKSFLADAEGSQNSASSLDNSAASTDEKVLTQQTKLPKPTSKFTSEREKASSVGKTNVEARKPIRRFVRSSLEKQKEPTTDTVLTGTEISTTFEEKASSSIDNEVTGDSMAQPTLARKRIAPPEPEILEGSVAQDETNIAAPPPHKRKKVSELSEISEAAENS